MLLDLGVLEDLLVFEVVDEDEDLDEEVLVAPDLCLLLVKLFCLKVNQLFNCFTSLRGWVWVGVC